MLKWDESLIDARKSSDKQNKLIAGFFWLTHRKILTNRQTNRQTDVQTIQWQYGQRSMEAWTDTPVLLWLTTENGKFLMKFAIGKNLLHSLVFVYSLRGPAFV